MQDTRKRQRPNELSSVCDNQLIEFHAVVRSFLLQPYVKYSCDDDGLSMPLDHLASLLRKFADRHAGKQEAKKIDFLSLVESHAPTFGLRVSESRVFGCSCDFTNVAVGLTMSHEPCLQVIEIVNDAVERETYTTFFSIPYAEIDARSMSVLKAAHMCKDNATRYEQASKLLESRFADYRFLYAESGVSPLSCTITIFGEMA
jgi:hypothetical protein